MDVSKIDITHGAHCDVTSRFVFNVICGWLRANVVKCQLIAAPCAGCSAARHDIDGHGPRTHQHILGIDNLSPADAQRISNGNKTTCSSVHLVNVGVKNGIPAILENPATSLIWCVPSVARLLRKASVLKIELCLFSGPLRKRTRFATWLCSDAQSRSQLCSSNKGC